MTTVINTNPGASAEAIQHHYDVSNEFYRLWLDETNTYSSALWLEDDAEDTLEAAQIRKLDYHINQARAKGANRVLDIGCGWGAIAKRLVEVYGVREAIGLTLSQEQADWVRSFQYPNIQVRVESWSDHEPQQPYDAIISIGAFEHFAQLSQTQEEKIAGYRQFFTKCHQWLQPGGYMSLQTISYENSRKEDFSDFYAQEIFPESDLPRLADIATASDRLFEIVALRSDREHYARTLKAWYRRLKQNRQAAVELVGEKIVQRYEKYLHFSIIGFHTGTMGLLRLTFRRIDKPRL
jgi:cyclopropane-fatty-acyl-phospholipid synthase